MTDRNPRIRRTGWQMFQDVLDFAWATLRLLPNRWTRTPPPREAVAVALPPKTDTTGAMFHAAAQRRH